MLKSDKYYKIFFEWEQLVLMLFGIFSRGDSIREVCDGMCALGGKLHYPSMDYSPAKSTAENALRDKNFLQYLNLSEGSMVVFDKAYNYYL